MNSRVLANCIVGMVLFNACSGAQTATPASKPPDSAQPSTKLEAFLGKRGRLVVKDFYDLGRVSSLGSAEFNGLVIYEPAGPQKIKGLRVEVTESGSLERSNTSFIDLDELPSLSDAISYISDLSRKWSGQRHEPYTEVIYVSKGEFSVGFYQRGTDASAFVRSGTIGAATAYLKTPDLERMKTLVDQAVVLLNSK